MTSPRVISRKLVGDDCRFKIEEFATRFGTVVWMLSDAYSMDADTGLPAIVAQEDTEEGALSRMRAILRGE